MPNAHSHAFQRAMAGNTEYRLSARDSFWTWRQAMYALANRIEPEDLQILATQLFVEMLKAGYTSVAEFHYLHGSRDGDPPTPARMPCGRRSATPRRPPASASRFLPTLYQTSDFGGQPLEARAGAIRSDTDEFLRAVEDRMQRRTAHAAGSQRTGAAFHSLRAVPLEILREAALALARRSTPACRCTFTSPSKCSRSKACLRDTGRRPIELLLDTGLVDAHWCLVHATHATRGGTRGHRRRRGRQSASPSAPRPISATDSSTRRDS